MNAPRSNPTPLRIGVLGCANIARQFVRDVAPSRSARVDAVASRDAAKAAAFATAHGIGRHHASYEALLADADLDCIYIPLPNSLHAEWAIKAAAAGKHILCEKPLALGLAEAAAMFDAARRHGVMLLEAYPYYFQPQTGDMLALLHGGAIGRVRSVQASFGFTLANPQGNIRMHPGLGGGALLDAGSYPLSLIRLAMGCAPARVTAESSWSSGGAGAGDERGSDGGDERGIDRGIDRGVDRGVDISTVATLSYADGRRAQLSCAMDTANHRHATIVGSAGTLETEYLNHTSDQAGGDPRGHLPSQLRVRRGTANHIALETVYSATGSGFRFAAEAFAKVVAERDFAAIERAAAASLDNAATLEAIALSAREGRPVAVAATSR